MFEAFIKTIFRKIGQSLNFDSSSCYRVPTNLVSLDYS